MGFDPAVWGPKTWNTLETLSLMTPPEEMVVVLDEMRNLIPCSHCRSSYDSYLAQISPKACIRTNEEALKYVWMLHDLVNSKLSKFHLPFTYLKARHAVFEYYVSPSDVLHVLSFISLDVDGQEAFQSYKRVSPSLLRLCTLLGGPVFDTIRLGDDTHTPSNVWMHALSCRNAFRSHLKMAPLTRDEFRDHYEMGRAPLQLPPDPDLHRKRGGAGAGAGGGGAGGRGEKAKKEKEQKAGATDRSASSSLFLPSSTQGRGGRATRDAASRSGGGGGGGGGGGRTGGLVSGADGAGGGGGSSTSNKPPPSRASIRREGALKRRR